MEQELITVIIPVYKVEAYLEKCVESVRNQTYANLEIILVDDGSPDGCPAMCDELAARDERIQVIHRENGGLSAARNTGLDAAKGRYVAFVDSDDYIASKMFEKLHAALIGARADMAVCDLACVDEQGEPTQLLRPLEPGVINREQVFQRMESPGGGWRW